MTTNSETKKELSKAEFRKIFTRSMTLDSGWNYERQQNMNFCYMMIPSLMRIYGDNKIGPCYLKCAITAIQVTGT